MNQGSSDFLVCDDENLIIKDLILPLAIYKTYFYKYLIKMENCIEFINSNHYRRFTNLLFQDFNCFWKANSLLSV